MDNSETVVNPYEGRFESHYFVIDNEHIIFMASRFYWSF